VDVLRVGGLLAVDDTDILTGTFLADFMQADPKWSTIMRHPSGRFAVFRKLKHPIHEDHWGFQPYLAESYPVRDIRVTRRRLPGRAEQKMASLLPGTIAGALQSTFGWPRAE
jgi:hypothetical protein